MRHRILASAYSCGPGEGSEPGIGWNIVREMSRRHDVTVITRKNNSALIESEIRNYPDAKLKTIGYDLPKYVGWFKRGTRGLQLYYYLWQFGAYRLAKRLHSHHRFELVHHVTFGRYWSPSFMPLLPIPFVSGPIGGGESAPRSFWTEFGTRARFFEWFREFARSLGELDPFVRMTLRRAKCLLATTPETASRINRLTESDVEIFGNVALEEPELLEYTQVPPPNTANPRFVSIGRILHWKGFHLGLRAFAEAQLDAEYWIVGSGSYTRELKLLAKELGIEEKVKFTGNIPREEVMECLKDSIALVHPSLHDSGGWVVIEAMASGRPVLCLDLGGPATIVDGDSGYKISAQNPEEAVLGLKQAMLELTQSAARLETLSSASKIRAQKLFTWESKADQLDKVYRRTVKSRS